MNTRPRLLAALALPLVMLAAMALNHQWQRDHGREVVLPIQGFDPRDLLAGHYLRYRIDYGIKPCQTPRNAPDASICLQPERRFSASDTPPDCKLYIRGQCRHGRFEAGIERFYIPETDARELETLTRKKHAALRLSIAADGRASIRELLIDGKIWSSQLGPRPPAS